ncbi:YeeE/YedE family protein [Spongiibacter sp. KMU-158]|uniref:YeeE/YedE family protein n=1 Tax=Spongiibacter pelagi TaxID=2760804 RepID=A0A927GX23_9GAMM|nr:YeeE/YedE family protein [Spongiibacter pelagi]MBD2858994.1 YeeE/YedE family protein [Spongiibacter pelagi]
MVEATPFEPVAALGGGVLIGLSALLLMWSVGRIAGISGIVFGAVSNGGEERNWRLFFIGGLFIGSLIAAWLSGALSGVTPVASTPMMIAAGLIVGFGTRMGSGCTSGHGVCGISRFSLRSVVATVTFMASGFITVFVIRHLLGEGL